MKRTQFILNSFLSFVSIYIPLFLYSSYYYFSLNNISRLEKNRELNEDLNLKIESVKNGALPTFYPANLLLLDENLSIYPIGTIPSTLSYLGNEGYGMIEYKSDRFGLRNDDQKWRKTKTQSNIFLIGDSFTHGACVPKEHMISNVIEKKLNINTLNLGTGGSTPYEYISVMKTLVSPFLRKSNQDNKVIIIFYPNDNVPINNKKEKLLIKSKSILNVQSEPEIIPSRIYQSEFNKLIKENYPLSKKEIISELLINNPKKNFKDSFSYYVFSLYPVRNKIKFLLNANKISLKKQISISTNSPSISEKSINYLAKICSKECQPYVAFIPNNIYMKPDSRYKEYKNELKRVSNKFSIPFIDGSEVINQKGVLDYAPKGHHLSIGGYEKFSDLIIERIE